MFDYTIFTYMMQAYLDYYPVNAVYLYYTFGIVNGKVDRALDSASLYLAAYAFNVRDVVTAYNDLVEKLNILYGEGIVDDGDDSTMLWSLYTQTSTV